ncbi:MAG: glutamate racemase [Chitinivibrionales bacterium]|nr:glutamate racemase [Chitinivibrionales bacterium]
MRDYSIGVFDSGYGGLTIMKEIVARLPRYSYIYLGDNGRAPYGNRSFETVYRYTLEAVQWLFNHGCYLVILACNTASAKALRTIQQHDLPLLAPTRRILGVIRPVTEIVGTLTTTKHIGLFGTYGTVKSQSYVIETHKFYPDITLSQEACPLWVPLIENNDHFSAGADYFLKRHCDALMAKDYRIDLIVLGCTHYGLIKNRIKHFLPDCVSLLDQGVIVAESLTQYLTRHREIEERLSTTQERRFFTSDSSEMFDSLATLFYGAPITSDRVCFS